MIGPHPAQALRVGRINLREWREPHTAGVVAVCPPFLISGCRRGLSAPEAARQNETSRDVNAPASTHQPILAKKFWSHKGGERPFALIWSLQTKRPSEPWGHGHLSRSGRGPQFIAADARLKEAVIHSIENEAIDADRQNLAILLTGLEYYSSPIFWIVRDDSARPSRSLRGRKYPANSSLLVSYSCHILFQPRGLVVYYFTRR